MNATEMEIMVPPDEIGEPKMRASGQGDTHSPVSPSEIPARPKDPASPSEAPVRRKQPPSASEIPPRSK
jgi:hypothetical protein